MTTTEESRTTVRTATEVLTWSRAVFDPALRAAVDTLPGSIRLIAGHHYGWWDEHGEPTEAHAGKAIRPTLALLAAKAVGADATAALPAAVAVELVHSFSLMHDDVMDGDRTRRHRPTTWAAFGVGAAILSGDALLALAFEVLTAGDHPAVKDAMRWLSAAVRNLVDGQSADMAFETRADVDLPECLSMAEGKTGPLLGCACALGALFGGAPAQAAGLRRFGERLGLAFQLVDDLLGIWGDPRVTGKAVYADLRQRKKSLPVVAALASGTAAGREFSALYHRETPLSDAELVHAAQLIEAAGGRTWCQDKADEILAEALRHLHSATPAERPAAELTALARLITRRDH